ncbi:polysaccharide lyase family 7 protein [Thalassotalea euphylliae]|uniref:polysaccharide lyase family 7 protein n=1 Tax=Thalassotalea euphylliae TaxID=1655234 RepID=UPI003642E846
MKKHNSRVQRAIALCCLSSALWGTLASATSVDIQNASFENNWDGWQDTDPSAISSDAYSGTKSAKISGSSGAFSQSVPVTTNTDYVLTAHVKGGGKIGVYVGGSTLSATAVNSSYAPISVNFNSGSQTQITLFGEYYSQEGRFDDFTLTATSSGGTGGDSGGNTGSTGQCSDSSNLAVTSATDNGTNDGHGPANTIDGNLADESRWSSNGSGKSIVYQLNSESTVTALNLVWFKGNSRTSFFDVDTSTDNNNWTSVLTSGQSSGSSSSYETVDVIDSSAKYVRITGYGNSSNTWNSIIETQILGCGESGDNGGDNGGGNSGGGSPGNINIELNDWYLGVPVDNDNNGKSDSISENDLVNGYEHPQWFYRDNDGALVFKAPIDAPKTSTNTSYTRSELREMLRRGDTSISTKGVNKNNWVFSTYSASDRSAAGGIDGELKATLKVDHVTTTGSSSQVGRVIIGQIHATNDEPARLYYRKLPGNSKGAIYLAHEPIGKSDEYYDMIGSRSSSASNPSDGIELGEVFSYSIKVVGNSLTVTIYRDGKADVVQTVDMSNSGYHTGSNEYMYFKAGVYNQNNTGNGDDYVQATFYEIVNTHDGYNY